MATKAELEKRIADLEQELWERDKAIRFFSSTGGMEIRLPQVARDMPDGDSPHISYAPGLGERLIEIMEPSLRRCGAKLRGTSPSKTMDLKENIHRGFGETILVPDVWGQIMAEIIDCAAKFGREAEAFGFCNGSDMLGRLCRGEITADEFDGSVEQAKAVRRQERKDVAMLIKSNGDLNSGESAA